jgi:hypothetical protein
LVIKLASVPSPFAEGPWQLAQYNWKVVPPPTPDCDDWAKAAVDGYTLATTIQEITA